MKPRKSFSFPISVSGLFTPVFLVMMLKRRPFESRWFRARITDVLTGCGDQHLKSKLGLFDPAADKLLMTVSYILITIPD
jgi:hypothetical protein